VREGRTLVFSSPAEFGACPKLAGRSYGAVSAGCVPVTFLGRPLGVLHVIGTESIPPDEHTVESLQAIATHAGHAIGEARADSLAGLDLDLDV
jgi:GAF domain-containing protein